MRENRAPDLATLGDLVRERRKSLNLTQVQLGDRLGWSQERIYSLENGKYGTPSLPLLAQLAEALHLPLGDVMEAMGFELGGLATGADPPRDREGAGTAIDHASAYTLQRLLGIEALNLKDALNQAADLMAETMGADKVDVFVYDREIDSLVAVGTSNTEIGRKQQQVGLDRVPLANGGRQVQVFQSQEAFYTGHADQDPEVARGIVETLGIRSLYGVPWWVNGSLRGIFVAASAQPERFSERDRAFFGSASRWVALVAHRAELHEELTRRTVEETSREVAEEMLATVAHDLGNQITPIKGRVDLLLRRTRRQGRDEDAEPAAELAAVSGALGRLSGMVADLLDASRLEGGIFSVNRQRFDLVELVEEVAATARAERAEIETRVPERLEIEADPARVRQAIQNLVGNAVQHTPSGTPVLVTIGQERRQSGPYAVIEVHDEGPGIDPSLSAVLFTRGASRGDEAGTGLGLYLAHGVATAHGGDLSVQSEVGKGTTFSLSLPL